MPTAEVSQIECFPIKDADEMDQFRECLLKAGLPH